MSNYRKNRREIEEMYGDDPFVSPELYGRMMEEADENDRRDEDNAEVLAMWEARAEAEAEEDA